MLHANGSSLDGKERIYFNNELVSEKRNIARVGEHVFEANGSVYQVVFTVDSILTGAIQCAFYKNDTKRKVYSCRYKKGKTINLGSLGVVFLLNLVYAFLKRVYALPHQFDYGIWAASFLFIFLTRRKGRFEIEELPIAHASDNISTLPSNRINE
ncbi:hypothetical protein [Hymenobacter sp. B81]|uniref:hypothetical protein n=1 Tax=Hymenobacter sp. B81 TaxID=3344878 RepID=UPI0037DDB50F